MLKNPPIHSGGGWSVGQGVGGAVSWRLSLRAAIEGEGTEGVCVCVCACECARECMECSQPPEYFSRRRPKQQLAPRVPVFSI